MPPRRRREKRTAGSAVERRTFLTRLVAAGGGAAALLPSVATLHAGADAAAGRWQPAMPGTAFGFEQVHALAAALAETPYREDAAPLPEAMTDLSPESYHAIGFRQEATLWRDQGLPFQVQLFPRGSYFRTPVAINVIDGDSVSSLSYDSGYFDFSAAGLAEAPPADLGFAGLRLLHPLNGKNRFDELGVFLGASYFRLLAAGQHYGLSARGLAIDTGLAKKEEFPRFKEFWLRRPRPGARSLEILALLDSESLTGAYHFTITPGAETTADVRVRLFTRSAVEKLGLAPLTSMFFYGENTTRRIDDLRPEVHDSDGMLLHTGSGEWIWRPLANRDHLQVSSFADANPRGFGLLQRDRSSSHYQDLGYNYARRPSAWVEPHNGWGKGAAQLIEIPSDSERYDNIGLFWLPERPVEAGQLWAFGYRLRIGSAFTDFPETGRTLATREASGSDAGLRRFAIVFGGGSLAALSDENDVELVVTASAGALLQSAVRRNGDDGTWLAVFEIDSQGEDAVELRAFLKQRENALTETWSYLWKRA